MYVDVLLTIFLSQADDRKCLSPSEVYPVEGWLTDISQVVQVPRMDDRADCLATQEVNLLLFPMERIVKKVELCAFLCHLKIS